MHSNIDDIDPQITDPQLRGLVKRIRETGNYNINAIESAAIAMSGCEEIEGKIPDERTRFVSLVWILMGYEIGMATACQPNFN